MSTSPGAGERIDFHCACGAHLKVPAKAAGKRVKCPKCQQAATVPVPAPVEEPAAGGLLDEIAALTPAAAEPAAPRPMAAAVPCPNCGVPLSVAA